MLGGAIWETVVGEKDLDVGQEAQAEEGCFKNKLCISITKVTKNKLIGCIQEHNYFTYLDIKEKRSSKTCEHQIYVKEKKLSCYIICFNKVNLFLTNYILQ